MNETKTFFKYFKPEAFNGMRCIVWDKDKTIKDLETCKILTLNIYLIEYFVPKNKFESPEMLQLL